MEPLQAPEGDVTAEHRATITLRVTAVLFLLLPAAALAFAAFAPNGNREGAPILIGSAVVLLALGVLSFVQQNRSRVVVRADGMERWGLRGQLWALRWADMAEL